MNHGDGEHQESIMNGISNADRMTVVVLCLVLLALLVLLQGCATSRTIAGAPVNDSYTHAADYQPVHEPTEQVQPIEGTLPFGFGAQINYFIDETSSSLGGFYSSVLKPMQKGQVFANKAYALDYAIRDRGDTFDNPVGLDRVRFRSHYDIRVGITRRFHTFGDLLQPGFWMGQPHYLNQQPRPDERNRPMLSMDQSFYQSGTRPQSLVGGPGVSTMLALLPDQE